MINDEKFENNPDYKEGFLDGFKEGNKHTQLYTHATLSIAIGAIEKIQQQLAGANPIPPVEVVLEQDDKETKE